MIWRSARRWSNPIVLGVLAAFAGAAAAASPQQSEPSHITIPFLANATRPGDLDFEAAACDVDRGGTTMRCTFEQLFLTTSDLVPDTCLVTTNRYDRSFTKQADGRWVSRGRPEGPCGIVDVTTLRDEGGVRWTMDMRKTIDHADAEPACRAMREQPEIMSWQNLRRALPCKFVQPGGLGR